MGRFVSATGQFLMATYGQFSCPPMGTFSCPLTVVLRNLPTVRTETGHHANVTFLIHLLKNGGLYRSTECQLLHVALCLRCISRSASRPKAWILGTAKAVGVGDEPRGGFVKLRSLRPVVDLRRCQVVGNVFAHDPDVSRWQKLCEVPQIERIALRATPWSSYPSSLCRTVTRGLLWRRSPRSVEALWRLFGRLGTLLGYASRHAERRENAA